jgi:hypothetical protein
MGSKSSDKHETRYASYIEDRHRSFLDIIRSYRDQTISYSESPYFSFATIDSDSAFLGTGYVLSNFASLHDMFGKFMAGLDIDSLFSEIFEDSLVIPEIDALTDAKLTLVDDNIMKDLIPQFTLSMRSLNAVISSSFIIGKTVLEERRTKLNAILSADFRYLLIPDITKRWIDSLNQKKKVIFSYAFAMKLQIMAKHDTDRYNYRLTLRHILWPFTVLEYERAALAALQSPITKKSSVKERSNISKVLMVASYTVSGALIGSYFGPWGTVIGAVIGFVIGLAIMFFE